MGELSSTFLQVIALIVIVPLMIFCYKLIFSIIFWPFRIIRYQLKLTTKKKQEIDLTYRSLVEEKNRKVYNEILCRLETINDIKGLDKFMSFDGGNDFQPIRLLFFLNKYSKNEKYKEVINEIVTICDFYEPRPTKKFYGEGSINLLEEFEVAMKTNKLNILGNK